MTGSTLVLPLTFASFKGTCDTAVDMLNHRQVTKTPE